MTTTEVRVPLRRRRWIVIGIATFGAMVAAGGFLWVSTVVSGYMNELTPSPWSGFSTRPGIAAFIMGSVILLGALITIRLSVRPEADGRLIWAFVWLAWVAMALNCFGTAITADPFNGIGDMLIVLSYVVGFIAVFTLVFGTVRLVVRLTSRDDRP
jgi:hypothetical protein